VLNGVSPQAVNAVLDPIVITMPLTIPGVLYFDIRQSEQLREAIASASQVYVATQRFLDVVSPLCTATKMILLRGSDSGDPALSPLKEEMPGSMARRNDGATNQAATLRVGDLTAQSRIAMPARKTIKPSRRKDLQPWI
jgi:hypothetical protein